MAKATKVIHRMEISEEEIRQRDLEEIKTRLLENKEAIHEIFDMIEHMQKRGVLDMGTSLFAEGDKVMDVIVKTLDSEETTNSLKNLLLMVGTLGTLNVQQLEPLILKVNAGIARVAELDEKQEQEGYFTLLRSLNDPEVKRAMAVGAAFLKGLGVKQDDYERTTQKSEDQKSQQSETEENWNGDIFTNEYHQLNSQSNPVKGNSDSSSKSNWLLPAGIALAAIPLSYLLKKK
ncbi:DUF1641 domain-containing protein [Jeotgalibacillus salarius]|uniref:DUF1641 domain-containing protein n=1 Tax=Jeotgalibacillus salarius TaxID=546023 RepID=A0A4Y8LLJ4_9BACL|nr:DUF1641 domain-containing protein [Jeotgalibacillus salarius]TFE02107.1 DUF1641 domain-containing protein [Jeotgalibacillus salarius]